MTQIWHEIIYRPLLNLLVGGYNVLPIQDFGLVIVLLTLAGRFLLVPLMGKQIKNQQQMSDLQTKVAQIKEQYKDDKEGQAKATMELYKTNNPLASCLPLLLQLPFFIGLYQVLRHILHGDINGLYSFVHRPELLQLTAFGFMDLTKPYWPLAVIVGILQYWQSKMMASLTPPKDQTAKTMQFQTLYILPAVTIFFSLSLPSGLTLSWLVNTVFMIVQQYFITKKKTQ